MKPAECIAGQKGARVAKDKKKAKPEKADKKAKKASKDKKLSTAATAAQTLKSLSENRLVSEVVAAALVATAAALKDSKKARQLASDAGDELGKLAKDGAKRGNAMWELALQIGRQSLEALAEEAPKRSKPTTRSKKSSTKGK